MPPKEISPPTWLNENQYEILGQLNSIGWSHVLMSFKALLDSPDPNDVRLSKWLEQRRDAALFKQALHRQNISADPFYWAEFFLNRPRLIPLLPFTLEQADRAMEGMNGFQALLRIDLNCTDKELKELFSRWLLETRKANIPFPIKKKHPIHGMFQLTETEHFDSWIHHKIVEVADLDLWGSLIGQKIGNRVIGKWIYGERCNNPEQRVSDARRKLAEVFEGLMLINVQSDAEAILALTDPAGALPFTCLSRRALGGPDACSQYRPAYADEGISDL